MNILFPQLLLIQKPSEFEDKPTKLGDANVFIVSNLSSTVRETFSHELITYHPEVVELILKAKLKSPAS